MNIKQSRKIVICILGVLTTIFTLSSCNRSQSGNELQGNSPEVSVVTLQPERISIITELPGRTSPYLIAEVRPQVSGIIQKRFFVEGSDIKAGDQLYQIDPATYEATYSAAKAALARSEANVISIRNRVERYKELVAMNAVSQQEFDDATAALKQAEADIQVNKAATETARINLNYTRVTAPITGRIGKSNVTVGALVTANQPSPLAVIQQLDPIYVDATQSSANLLELKRHIAAGRIKGDGPNQTRVRLILEDGTPYPLEGTLKFSDVTVDASTGSFIQRMIFPNPKYTLLPGMYARALVQEGVAENAILVPQQAVSRDPKGNPLVLTVDASGKVEQRMITVSRAIGNKWNVASGLEQGDKVIVEGIQRVRPGMAVKVVPFGSTQKGSAETGKNANPPEKTTPPPEKAK
ncbi:MAG TPA: efflux RND transporter periplasmic adaptor subunit [Syntrophorhabdus sp.]|nr:efflux RND transporter periplasmic adaptor subunit [Syntrophorhabdus sp.]HPW35038.1 efflux RND transporter periplasmic adaptor subunit [Syntrophorhabdus sp.]